eukprot:CAMPEP_0116856282 /NCGR_PEP_ID=MMETSP0418-20121206/19812_1 /TAXON_ID=1158023 /ORGANISM="Astrosyne radiata, Strain 13vi08-1A" /LENGTH=53 /DNA_ID=CAMNT_0004489639 /DNA_START=88 /DNA_END=245 /DNA_ORIENTATION=-
MLWNSKRCLGALASLAIATTAGAQSCVTIQQIQGQGDESPLLDRRVLACGAYV